MTISQLLRNIKINCPHNTVQIDVLRIKPTVLYDTNSVIRKQFLTKFTVQYKPSQAKLGEICPPPDLDAWPFLVFQNTTLYVPTLFGYFLSTRANFFFCLKLHQRKKNIFYLYVTTL